MNRDISIIIPRRMNEDADITINSLKNQTYTGFKTLVVPDEGKGANWARNKGFEVVDTEFVLFSDNDIEWKASALENLRRALKITKASFSYGRYQIGDSVWCHQYWDPQILKKRNYISTMSLIRTKDFPGFDPDLKRFQDWDLWLTMMEQGKYGTYVNDLIFTTEVKDGITYNNPLGPKEGSDIIKIKHKLI